MIKSKVVSLELAKRMKKLGWKKETLYIWVYVADCKMDDFNKIQLVNWHWEIWDKKEYEMISSVHPDMFMETCPASLFCEVWEELPVDIVIDNVLHHLDMPKTNFITSIGYTPLKSKLFTKGAYKMGEKSIQENAGELWCWLKANGYK